MGVNIIRGKRNPRKVVGKEKGGESEREGNGETERDVEKNSERQVKTK